MAGEKGGRSLEETPTWAVALVCFVLVVVSIIIEHIIHLIAQWLTKRRKTALYEALEKIKSEVMLLGFISLLLAVGQGPISNICISKALGATWHPCTKKHETKLNKNEENTTTSSDNGHRRLLTISDLGGRGGGSSRRVLAGAGYYDKCADKEKVALVSADGIHRLHIFIFVLAVFHVLYCITTLAFCRAKMRKWKAWERETRTADYQFSHDPERFRFARETSFGRRHLSFWSRSSVLLWIVCFFRQFVRSVPKVDYLTLRHGFIIAHLAPQSQTMFNFQQYIKRSLEEDFKVVVGIRLLEFPFHTCNPTIWLFAVLFLLSNTHGLYSYLWLPFIPLIIILLVGTKLQVIITKMGLRFQERGEVVKGTPLVQPRDDLFWFNRPHLLLYLIHFVLFQNAFQLAFYAWTWYEFGLKSCFHDKLEDVIIRIFMGLLIQFLCSYVTLPLYALVTQMGSTMKPTIFNERVVNAIRKWHQTAKKHIKQSRQSASTPGTPLHSASPVHLLRHYKGDLDSFPTSPRMSSLNIEDCEMGRSHSPSRRHDHGKQGQEERDAHELRPTRAREIDIHSTDFSFEKRWIN